MFTRLFIRILAIFCMMGFGMIARKLGIVDKNTSSQMSRVITNFFYPSLIFTSLVSNYTLQGLATNWVLPAGTMAIMATGYLVGRLFAGSVSFSSHEEKNQFIFQCATNNYSFLPLPIILMLWGEPGVAKLVFSTLGSEVSVWTLGIFALTGNRFRKENLKNLVSLPMLSIFAAVAVIAVKDYAGHTGMFTGNSQALNELGISLFSVLDIFGKAAIPVAMFVAGSRMADLKSHHLLTFKQAQMVALRLLAIPLLALALLLILPFSADIRLVLMVVATMPSAVSSVVLSEVYGSDTEFAASSVLTTHLFSLLTIPMWLSFFLR